MGINVSKCIQRKQKINTKNCFLLREVDYMYQSMPYCLIKNHVAHSRLKRLQKCFAICPLEKLGVCEKCASGGVC
jgi:hypothetical protein